MKKKNKLVPVLCALAMAGSIPVKAENEDFSNTAYWNNLCTSSSTLTTAQQQSCSAYMTYMQQQNASLSQQIADIDSKKDEISANIKEYASQISTYNTQISSLNGMIADLNAQLEEAQAAVESKQAEIDANQTAIGEKQQEAQTLKQKLSDRMVEQQKSMRTYQFLDVLMGAKTFSDLVRIAEGMTTIEQHDSHTLDEYKSTISELSDLQNTLQKQKDDLQATLDDIQEGQTALQSQQEQLLVSRHQAEVIQQSLDSQVASGRISQQEAEELINSNASTIANVAGSISDSRAAAAATPTPSASQTPAEDNQSSADQNTSSDAPAPSENQNNSSSDNNASSTTNNSTTPSSSDSSGNPYYGGWSNCTWGAWQLAHDILGVSLPWFAGNAGDWLADAQAAGMSTGSTPAANSIVVMNWHVAFVAEVSGDSIYIKEGNYMGRYNERWLNGYAGNILGYIYL